MKDGGNTICGIFLSWLAERQDDFAFSPEVLMKGENNIVVAFAGISRRLRCTVNNSGGIEIRVMFRKMTWDLLADFSISVKQDHGGGWYCGICGGKYGPLFSSQKDLLESHSLYPLQKWLNLNLKKNKSILIFGNKGYNTAKLSVSGRKLERVRVKDLIRVLPLHEQVKPKLIGLSSTSGQTALTKNVRVSRLS
jgi:hypothetical protein